MTDPVDPERWRTIEAVFDAALDLPSAQRSAFVDEACAADAALRAEVASLLAAHARAEDYLEIPVASLHEVLSSYRPGQRIGPYELLHEIGRGGLGVVFLAADTRLGRKVALKLLPAWRTADPEARARFHREAVAAAALDHPHICTVYEIGQAEAADPYIAMAHVEGDSLKDRIARGPLPLADAIDIAVQTAAGLAHAHEHGIVHRDVKPANLIVTPAGQVQIIDFGLAKCKGSSITLTREGVTPGTVSYMSPEQIRGEQVDHRSDIWALGVVLYEMITGRPPFRGEDEQSRTFAILNQDPEPLTAMRAGVPLSLEPIVAKALAKGPANRYQHVDELPVDLRSALGPRSGPIHGMLGPAVRLRIRISHALLLAGVLAAALVAVVALDHRSAPDAQLPLHLSILLPPEQDLAGGLFGRFAISPDGMRLVYAAESEGREQLHLRSLDRIEARPIPGTENARDPFFSPDGRWVGFFAEEELRKVSLKGGAPQKICDAPAKTSRGASWGQDGTIILPLGQLSGLFRVPDGGGVPEPLTFPVDDTGGTGHFFPQILPDGRSVLFTIWRATGGWSTAILDLKTGEWEEIVRGCAIARYAPAGYLVCAEMVGVVPTGSLLVAPFTLQQRAQSAPFVAALQPVGFQAFDFSISATGALIYATDLPGMNRTSLTWVPRDSRPTRLGEGIEGYFTPSLSPDGRRVAVTRRVEAGRQELWLYDLGSGTSARLSAASTISNMPLWFPDGERVLFNSLQSPAGLYSVRADLGDTATLVLRRQENILVPGSFSPDGRFLGYTELNPRTLGDVWILSLDDGSIAPFVRTPSNEHTPTFSTDGRWLAYASDESGRDEVYVRPYPGPGAPIQISTGGGREPLWSPDGAELFYRRGDAMLAVPVKVGRRFSAGRAVTLFNGRYATEYIGVRHYDVASDGRFLMVQIEPSSAQGRLGVVLNWFGELERLVPGGS